MYTEYWTAATLINDWIVVDVLYSTVDDVVASDSDDDTFLTLDNFNELLQSPSM